MFAAASEGIWSAASASPQFQALLSAFADLHSFGEACNISTYASSSGSYTFAQLNPAQRQHVLFLLDTCELNGPRRIAFGVRNFYIDRTYGALQEPLSGVHQILHADQVYIDQHRPQLAPSRLRYDSKSKQIVSISGDIDYLIVGSGPAGSVLAHELRRGGKRVVLVERGSFLVPGSTESRQVGSLIDSRTSEDGGIIIHNGLAVGGGTQVNVDLCFAPTRPSVLAKIGEWKHDGRVGKDDFTEPELASAYTWVKSAIGTRSLPEDEINGNNHVLWDGSLKAGLHPKLYDLNTYPPGKSPYPVTDKRSSESQLLIDALEDQQNPLSLIPDADVRKVLFEDAKAPAEATGVELRMRSPIAEPGVISDPNHLDLIAGTVVTIRAKTIILSAGALGSPTILLRSGIENDSIGRGVVLHVSMPILSKFDHPIDALKGTQSSVYVDDKLISDGYAFESMSAPPSYAALMSPGPAQHTLEMVQNYRNLAGFGVMLIDTPSPQNRLTIDAQGEPSIAYELSASDKARMRRGVAEAIRIMFLAGAKEVYLPTTEDVLGLGKDLEGQATVLKNIAQADLVEKNLQFIPNRTILTSAHMQATDKMGSDPAKSVVSRDFRVWGKENLYVVDGSIFPTSIGATQCRASTPSPKYSPTG